METVCKAIGFTVEQTAKLLSGKRLSFRGSLYSEEHKRKFDTESLTAQIIQDLEAKKLHLLVDSKHIGEWLKQKQKEFLNSLGINPKEKNGAENQAVRYFFEINNSYIRIITYLCVIIV